MKGLIARQHIVLILCGALIALVGCSTEPTYKKENLTEDLKGLLTEKEMDSEVKLLEHTLAVHVSKEETLVDVGHQIGIGPQFDEISKDVVPIMHRIIMSTDADIQFYVLLLTDPTIPGAYLMLIRSVEDIKKLNVSLMDVEEFFSRTIMELNFLGDETPINLEVNVQRDITLPEFLSWQISRRIQRELVRTFAETDAIEVGRCVGEFFNDSFIFTLNVVPTDDEPISDSTVQSTFEAATEVIQQVLHSYDYQDYSTVRLIHHPSGKHLVLKKDMLEKPLK